MSRYDLLVYGAAEYAAGRGSDVDPTADLRPDLRDAVRSDAMARLRRLESMRISRVEAARHRAAHSCDGDLIEGSLSGTTTGEAPTLSWDTMVAALHVEPED